MTLPPIDFRSMQKAETALAGARLLLAAGDTAGACSRVYYAMFHAAHAALWAVGAEQPGTVIKTHNGLISLFGQQIVKPGLIEAEHGRAIGYVQKTRLLADYTDEPPTGEAAAAALALAEAFVAAIRARFAAKPSR